MQLSKEIRMVKACRELLQWTQKDLAKAAKLGSSTVGDFERGRTVDSDTIKQIRETLYAHGAEYSITNDDTMLVHVWAD